jgi:hypothetical protein
MACRFEEEIKARDGRVEVCGCPSCPYKAEGECFEVLPPREDFCQPQGYLGPYSLAQAIDLIAESDRWANEGEDSRIKDLYR